VRLQQIVTAMVGVVLLAGCTREDPARVELRARLKQNTQLTTEEVGKVLDEVGRSLEGKTVQLHQDGKSVAMTQEQNDVVLGMLKYRAGVFDETLRTENGVTYRVINAPGESNDPEYEATRRLLVDVETFLPRRFEFSFGVPGMPGAYSYDLDVN